MNSATLLEDIVYMLCNNPTKVVVLSNLEIALEDAPDTTNALGMQRLLSPKCGALKTYYLDMQNFCLEIHLDGDILRRARKLAVVPVINDIATYLLGNTLQKEIVGKVVLRRVTPFIGYEHLRSE